MAGQQGQPVIIKKVKKGGHGHHGGAWKVAYADFVTAMMAFFLLLWLLNATTQEQKRGISNYFAPISMSKSSSGAGGILGGKTIGSEGAMQSTMSPPSVTLQIPPVSVGEGGEEQGGETSPAADIDDATAKEILARREEEQFKEAERKIRKAIHEMPQLQGLAQNLLIDNTPEGLRIQLIDQEGLAMFPLGSVEPHTHTRKLLEMVAQVVQRLPQKIEISGHSDAARFANPNGYGNWELSADRANASRRVLLEYGLSQDRIARVVGKADTDPLVKDDPLSPRNRRISIVLLRKQPMPPETPSQVPAPNASKTPAKPVIPKPPTPQGQDGKQG